MPVCVCVCVCIPCVQGVTHTFTSAAEALKAARLAAASDLRKRLLVLQLPVVPGRLRPPSGASRGRGQTELLKQPHRHGTGVPASTLEHPLPHFETNITQRRGEKQPPSSLSPTLLLSFPACSLSGALRTMTKMISFHPAVKTGVWTVCVCS